MKVLCIPIRITTGGTKIGSIRNISMALFRGKLYLPRALPAGIAKRILIKLVPRAIFKLVRIEGQVPEDVPITYFHALKLIDRGSIKGHCQFPEKLIITRKITGNAMTADTARNTIPGKEKLSFFIFYLPWLKQLFCLYKNK